MTTHQLAAILLSQPNIPVVIQDYEGYLCSVTSVKESVGYSSGPDENFSHLDYSNSLSRKHPVKTIRLVHY